MTILRAASLLLFGVIAACSNPQEKPEDTVNNFLRAVRKHDCKKVFYYFSTSSQGKVREESAKAVSDYPTYAEQLTPEKFYCSSMFASRFRLFNLGSATVQKIEENNAVVGVTYTEGTNELIPGFFPMKFVKKPDTIQVVREDGRWKIDLVTPSPAEKEAIATREKAKANEVSEDGQIHFGVQRITIHSNERLQPQKFYRLAFAWGESGMRIYIDGELDSKSDRPAQITATAKLTELGRDPNNPEKPARA